VTKTSTNDLVRPVHNRVRGRIRFEVVGLYRARPLKRVLERRLGEIGGVEAVQASTLTGRLLVVYSPDAVVAERLSHEVRASLDAWRNRLPAHKRQRATGISMRRRRSRSRLLQPDELVAVLRSLIPAHQPQSVFAASASASTSGVEDSEAQAVHPWHAMNAADVLSQLGLSNDAGLTATEAKARLRRYGPNSLEADQRRSDLSIFLGQFNSLPVGLLGVSAVVAVATGGALDAVVILGVVMINSAIGFVTERQAETTIASLADTDVRMARVIRNGEALEIPAENIVPGDMLQLAPGDYVAADLRIVHSHRLSVDESALTGESLPVGKDHAEVAEEDTALGDRVNMAYMGTHVTGGNGRGVVIATAGATELGKIQTMVGEAQAPETPMQKQLDRMGTQLALLSGAVCAGVFGVGLLRGFGWIEMLKSSVSLAVAAVPEGLPAVATTTLAMGIKDMRSRNVAVRHLDAVETLGSVQVFCLDKTGTLTMNRMAVVSMHAGQEDYAVVDRLISKDGKAVDPRGCEELLRLMQIVSLCSETVIHGSPEEHELEGSATENALVELALNAGLDVPALREQFSTRSTRYRAEGRPYMSTLHSSRDGEHLLAVKGSPDQVLAVCDHQIRNGRRVRLTEQARELILAANDRMAGDALRVLGVAYRDLGSGRMPAKTAKLTWLGLAGMADPMRAGMDELMAIYHRAGIRTVMITGDQSATAEAIGRQLGLAEGRPLRVLESTALEAMDPELLAGLAKDVHVFARVSPVHKLKIVQALQGAGSVVAMTGDGINDGPALKAADIGVAMGGVGTDVARSVSDVVLEDDNLHTMAVAVRQGRTIYNNIRKTIHFMVSTNLTEIEIMLAGIALGLGQPMNAMQLLWINLVTDIFPGLALSLEPAEADIMDRPPRDPSEPIIGRADLKRMFFESATIGAGTLAAFLYGRSRYGAGAPQASTLAFTTLTVNELAHALSSRSRYRTLFSGHALPPNPHLKRAILGMLAAQGLATWVPGLRRLLGTSPLGIADLLVVALGTLVPLLVNESSKPSRPPMDESWQEELPADEVETSADSAPEPEPQANEVAST
jgi:Ca2+-transporting ATPase